VRGDDFYLAAFNRLGTCRQFPGNGFGPIPWTAARDYAHEHGLSPTVRAVFCDVMLLLDSAYRQHALKKLRDGERARQREEREAAKAAATATGAGVGSRRRRP